MPIVLDPIVAPSQQEAPLPGIESLHVWQPAAGGTFQLGGVDPTSRNTWPNYRVEKIDGRHAKPDLDDNRDVATARIGEIVRRSLLQGKTEAWQGLVRGRTLLELRQGAGALQAAFAENDEGLMTIRAPLPYKATALLTNLVTNPSYETNISGAQGSGSFLAAASTLSQQADALGVGSYSLKVVTPATAATGARVATALNLTAGVTYPVQVRLREEAGGSPLAARLCLDAAPFTEYTIVAAATPGSGGFTIYSADITPSVSGTYVVYARTTAATVSTFYVDGVAVGTPSYFDGDTPGYGWNGTPHGSTSSTADFPDFTYTARVIQCSCPDEQTLGPDRVETGGWERPFTLGLRLADPRYYEAIQRTSSTSTPSAGLLVRNGGTAPAEPILELTGPATDPAFVNDTVNGALVFAVGGLTLTAGQVLTIDFKARTMMLGTAPVTRDRIDWTLSNWWDAGMPGLKPGDNLVRYTGGGSPTLLTARWNNPRYS